MQVLTMSGIVDLRWKNVVKDLRTNEVLEVTCDPVDEGNFIEVYLRNVITGVRFTQRCYKKPGQYHPDYKVIL